MSERWRDVFDWIGLYRVSDWGRVKSVRTGKLMTQPINSKGYPCVRLSNGQRRTMPPVHRLVALAFHGMPPAGKPEVNHIDGNKQNNGAQNLEWVSSHGNRKHAWDMGLRNRSHLPIKYGDDKPNARLTAAVVAACRKRQAAGEPIRALAREFCVDAKTMRQAIKGKTWKLPPPPVIERGSPVQENE